jgi:hypothetical protein
MHPRDRTKLQLAHQALFWGQPVTHVQRQIMAQERPSIDLGAHTDPLAQSALVQHKFSSSTLARRSQ